jgi:hypothetical protein
LRFFAPDFGAVVDWMGSRSWNGFLHVPPLFFLRITKQLIDQTLNNIRLMPRKPSMTAKIDPPRPRHTLETGLRHHRHSRIWKQQALKPGSFTRLVKDALYQLALDQYAVDGAATLAALEHAHGPLRFRHPRHVIENKAAPARACMLAKTFLNYRPMATCLPITPTGILRG